MSLVTQTRQTMGPTFCVHLHPYLPLSLHPGTKTYLCEVPFGLTCDVLETVVVSHVPLFGDMRLWVAGGLLMRPWNGLRDLGLSRISPGVFECL